MITGAILDDLFLQIEQNSEREISICYNNRGKFIKHGKDYIEYKTKEDIFNILTNILEKEKKDGGTNNTNNKQKK